MEELKAVPEDLSTIVVVLHRVLNKTEAVDITHIGVTVSPEKVEATNRLLNWGENRIRSQ